MTTLLAFALRLLRRDLASGRLLVMLAAAIIAVASAASINLLVNRVERVMVAESSALLAADLALRTTDPVDARHVALAADLSLKTARTVTLRSVVEAGDRLQLVRLKAVDARYPLRGELVVSTRFEAPAAPVANGPPRGEVWVDRRLAQLLELDTGTELGIGRGRYPVSRILVFEPDRGGDVFTLAPRVMMNFADLEATGLMLPGTRATHALLIAGAPEPLDQFRQRATLDDGEKLIDPRDARPEMQSAFVQAERFLALAAFAGILLASIGIALAANAYGDHHELGVAILKTLGLTRREVARVLALEIACLALIAAVAGNLLAWGVHETLVRQLMPGREFGALGIPWLPLLHGAWVALVVLGGFALPALLRLVGLPVTTILNRDRAALPAAPLTTVLGMITAVALIAPWHVGNPRLIALAFAGMMAAAVGVALVSALLVRLLGSFRGRTAMSWRFGLANIARRARLSVVQTTAIGLGIAVILLLGVVREDLFTQWQARLPAEAPNQFLINIQPDEVDAMAAFLAMAGYPNVDFYPMIRGRLAMINDRIVSPDDYPEPRARRLADREFNLSWSTTLKADNTLLAGRWWSATATGEMSVEQGLARRLGIEMGDELGFTVADQLIRGRVTSLRGVEWDNFEVNFFVVTTPDLLRDAPTTYITAFYLPGSDGALLGRLVERFPSVTVIDVDALMIQVRQVMNRVSAALAWVFLFAVLAGVLVLAAAVQASQRERVLDVVLLKTLGAPRRFITITTLVEFMLLGLVAGLLGSLGAVGTGWLLAEAIFDMPYSPDWRIPLAGIVSGVAGVLLIGLAVVTRTHRQSVMVSLRSAN